MHTDLRSLLLASGASEEDVDRAEREGWLPLLTLDRLVLPGRPTHDVADVAARTGLDADELRRLWRAVGFPDVPEGLAVFTDADVEAARQLLAGGLAHGSDFETLLRQVRVISSSMARIAVALRAAAIEHGLPPVRTGLAAGMVVARDGDFYGPVVNLASRLTEVVPPGEIYTSEAMHDQLAADPSFTWSPVGPLELRSIGPVEVYALNSPDGSPDGSVD